MRRGVQGDFLDFGEYDGNGSGRLTPAGAGDVQFALNLCRELGVVLALSGVGQADSLMGKSVLWVELGGALAGCQPLPDDPNKWFVQPGTLVSDLVDAGLTQFADQPGYLTIAAWVADRSLCGWAPGESHCTGLLHASVLMADGSSGVLGPFGARNRMPLGTLTLQTLVPQLFALMAGEPAAGFATLDKWPARYRLDAMAPRGGGEVNLSHLMLGHGGDLGWIQWLILEARPPLPSVDWATAYTSRPPPGYAAQAEASTDSAVDVFTRWKQASTLDASVKNLFDPKRVFPDPGQDL
ncbi:MAG TPA: FAD-binding protein [Pusillimonas sp.]|uniref:FAD-binding protein n=1 Tax=Pusillimonas sp. TaxID=3040095 RepID=UPI002B4B5D03|nr:FAD-binding protein [Pusillimonas sp.]HLU19647.1 FAD-binding protein [Pusillimonas sp.]